MDREQKLRLKEQREKEVRTQARRKLKDLRRVKKKRPQGSQAEGEREACPADEEIYIYPEK